MIVGYNCSYWVIGRFFIIINDPSDAKDELSADSHGSSIGKKLNGQMSGHDTAEALVQGDATLLKNILDSTDDGISFFDNNGDIMLVNNKFREIWNIPDDAGIGKNYIEAFNKYGVPQLENASEVFSKIKTFSKSTDYDSGLLYFKDGRIFEYHLFPVITDGMIKGHVCSYRDITMSKKGESDLQEYARELERSNELKDLFTDIIRHDLLNPAGLVKGFVEILLRREFDPDTTEKLLAIKRSNGKIIDMIESASKLSKLESISELEFREFDAGAFLRMAAEPLRGQFESKNIVLENNATGTYKAKISPVVEDVFANLLSNAVKYSPENSKVIVDILDNGEEWKVAVTDFGEGVADEDKPYVFERFKRVNKVAVKGTGLGLAIVKRIIDLHGGKVGVENNPGGNGSVFWVTVKKA